MTEIRSGSFARAARLRTDAPNCIRLMEKRRGRKTESPGNPCIPAGGPARKRCVSAAGRDSAKHSTSADTSETVNMHSQRF
jgi:hypothetical protein